MLDLSQRLEKDTQLLVNKSIGREYKTFIQSDFFGQGRKKSFFELDPREQKSIVEEILPINQLPEWEEEAKKAYALVQAKHSDLCVEYERLDAAVAALNDHLLSIDSSYHSWSTEHDTHLLQLRGEVEGRPKVVETKEELERQLEVETKTYRIALDRSTEWLSRVNLLTHAVKNLEPSVTCFTCLQPLPKESVDFIKRKKIKAEKDLTEAKACNNLAIAIIEKTNDGIMEINNKLGWLNSRRELDKASLAFNPLEDTFKSTIEVVGLKVEEMLQLRKSIDKYEAELRRLGFWEIAFSRGLKLLMLKQACPFLQDKTNEYLRHLNNPWLCVEFSTSKELKSGDLAAEFSVTARSVTGGNEYDLLSGGEQQIINFAAGLAIADLAETQTVGASHTIILDEPFTELSQLNCENVVNFLTNHLSNKKSTILLISNEQTLKGLIPNQIHVTKKNGISSIQA